MNDEMSFEAIFEERRKAWGAPTRAESEHVKSAAMPDEFSQTGQQTNLEDTVPLPRYRPERL